MRVVHYIRPSGLDSALPTALALGKRVNLNLIFEISPECHNRGTFGSLPAGLPEGVHRDALKRMESWLPPQVEAQLHELAGFHMVVHHCRRAFYPQTIFVAARAASLIRSLQPDVVHFHDTWTRAAWTFPLLGRIPIVTSVHNVEDHPGDPPSRIQTIRRWALRFVSHIIFYSPYCEHLYRDRSEMPRVPTSVVPLAAMEIFRAWETRMIPEEPRTVLCFGRLSAYKGIHVLQEAMPLVAREVPDVRFIVAGAPVPNYTIPHFPMLPNGGQVELRAQFIPPDLLCELFQRAALVVLPYVSATQSGVVMTAYAFKKPVVATCVGALPEQVEDQVTGLLVPPNDSIVLANAIVELLLDHRLRAHLAGNIERKLSAEFSWQRVAEKIMTVYQSVTQRQQPA